MAFVFLVLAAGLAFIGSRVDPLDKATRWALLGFALLNAAAAVVAFAAGDWRLLPALKMEWW